MFYAESNGKLPHLVIPSKTATMVPEFVMEDLPFVRTAAFVPKFTSERPVLVENTLLISYTVELRTI